MSALSAADIEAAVLGGAIAWFDHNQAARMDSARFAPDGRPWRWEHLSADDQRGYLALARPVVADRLAAASPPAS